MASRISTQGYRLSAMASRVSTRLDRRHGGSGRRGVATGRAGALRPSAGGHPAHHLEGECRLLWSTRGGKSLAPGLTLCTASGEHSVELQGYLSVMGIDRCFKTLYEADIAMFDTPLVQGLAFYFCARLRVRSVVTTQEQTNRLERDQRALGTWGLHRRWSGATRRWDAFNRPGWSFGWRQTQRKTSLSSASGPALARASPVGCHGSWARQATAKARRQRTCGRWT